MDWNNRKQLSQPPCSMNMGEITDFDILEEQVRENLEFIYRHCQKHLDANAELLKGKCCFYFHYDWRVNAFSYRNKDCRKIAIFLGVNHGLDEVFTKFLESKQVGIHVAEFAKTTTLMWIYFHELAHQIQNREAVEFESVEMVNSSKENTEIKHLDEYDADMYATMNVCSAVSGNAKDLNDSPEVVLEKMGALCACLFWFFNSLSKEKKDLYFYTNSHPHYLIRSLYLIDRVEKFVRANHPELQPEKVFNFFVEYLKIIAEVDKSINIERLISIVHSEGQSIADYVQGLQMMQGSMANSAIKLDPNIINQ